MKPEDFIMMPIPAASYTAVCALLGGAAVAVLGNQTTQKRDVVQPGEDAQRATAAASEQSDNSAGGEPSSISTTATSGASPSENVDTGEIDAHGHPWSEELHASTRSKTKDGLWRMKVGVSRPEPLPGFPKEEASAPNADTGTSPATGTPSATSPTATAPESAPPATSTAPAAEEDEFAAFRAAAASSDAVDQAAAAAVPARQYSDADLGALCNQGAVKLGDPNPIKEIIARFVPEGQVAHSRNIPAERRAEFVKAVEDKAGISFAG